MPRSGDGIKVNKGVLRRIYEQRRVCRNKLGLYVGSRNE